MSHGGDGGGGGHGGRGPWRLRWAVLAEVTEATATEAGITIIITANLVALCSFGYQSIWRIGFWRPRYYRGGVYINPGGCLFALVFFSIVGIFMIAQYRWVVVAGTILCLFALIAFLSRKPANTGGGGGYYQAPGQYPPNQAPGQYPPNPGP